MKKIQAVTTAALASAALADGDPLGTAITRVQAIAREDDGDFAFVLDCTVELADGRLVFTGAERLSHLSSAVRPAG